MRATQAVRTALMTGAMLCGTVPIVQATAAHADDLAIEPRVVRPGQRVTVTGTCTDADDLVRVTGAARGVGAVRDGWFSVNALVNDALAGSHVLRARCAESRRALAGRLDVRPVDDDGDPGPDHEGDGFGREDEFGHEGDHGGHDKDKGKHAGGGLFKQEKVVIGDFEEKKKGGGGFVGGGVGGGGVGGGGVGGGGVGGGGGGVGAGGPGVVGRGPSPTPRGYVAAGGGGTQGPEVPWLPAGVVLLVTAAGIGGTVLIRSRARARA